MAITFFEAVLGSEERQNTSQVVWQHSSLLCDLFDRQACGMFGQNPSNVSLEDYLQACGLVMNVRTLAITATKLEII